MSRNLNPYHVVNKTLLWTLLEPDAWAAARDCATGAYQLRVLEGLEALSGSTLTGRASRYRRQYQDVVKGLRERLEAAGLATGVAENRQGKQILVVGSKRWVRDICGEG